MDFGLRRDFRAGCSGLLDGRCGRLGGRGLLSRGGRLGGSGGLRRCGLLGGWRGRLGRSGGLRRSC
ncbi:MAG TPA: hypothetical protein VI122_10700, partial [Thermoleophilaceae bacterium]